MVLHLTSAVLEHLIPIFFSGGPCVTPPKARSTIKAETFSVVVPVAGSVIGVLQNTVKISAMPPLEIQILPPLRIQCVPSALSSARVLMLPASEPLLGSVRAKAAKFSPVASLGRYCSFCASVPHSRIP